MTRVLIAHEDKNGRTILFLYGGKSYKECLHDIKEFTKSEDLMVKHCCNENDLFERLAKF